MLEYCTPLSNFSEKLSKGLKRPKKKFVHQMLYGILTGNKIHHLSEIARSLKEDITLKKTFDRLSRNLFEFECQSTLWSNYLTWSKNMSKMIMLLLLSIILTLPNLQVKKLEALTDIREGSTGEITKDYQTIEAAVLSESNKIPLPIYQKVFFAECYIQRYYLQYT